MRKNPFEATPVRPASAPRATGGSIRNQPVANTTESEETIGNYDLVESLQEYIKHREDNSLSEKQAFQTALKYYDDQIASLNEILQGNIPDDSTALNFQKQIDELQAQFDAEKGGRRWSYKAKQRHWQRKLDYYRKNKLRSPVEQELSKFQKRRDLAQKAYDKIYDEHGVRRKRTITGGFIGGVFNPRALADSFVDGLFDTVIGLPILAIQAPELIQELNSFRKHFFNSKFKEQEEADVAELLEYFKTQYLDFEGDPSELAEQQSMLMRGLQMKQLDLRKAWMRENTPKLLPIMEYYHDSLISAFTDPETFAKTLEERPFDVYVHILDGLAGAGLLAGGAMRVGRGVRAAGQLKKTGRYDRSYVRKPSKSERLAYKVAQAADYANPENLPFIVGGRAIESFADWYNRKYPQRNREVVDITPEKPRGELSADVDANIFEPSANMQAPQPREYRTRTAADTERPAADVSPPTDITPPNEILQEIDTGIEIDFNMFSDRINHFITGEGQLPSVHWEEPPMSYGGDPEEGDQLGDQLGEPITRDTLVQLQDEARRNLFEVRDALQEGLQSGEIELPNSDMLLSDNMNTPRNIANQFRDWLESSHGQFPVEPPEERTVVRFGYTQDAKPVLVPKALTGLYGALNRFMTAQGNLAGHDSAEANRIRTEQEAPRDLQVPSEAIERMEHEEQQQAFIENRRAERGEVRVTVSRPNPNNPFRPADERELVVTGAYGVRPETLERVIEAYELRDIITFPESTTSEIDYTAEVMRTSELGTMRPDPEVTVEDFLTAIEEREQELFERDRAEGEEGFARIDARQEALLAFMDERTDAPTSATTSDTTPTTTEAPEISPEHILEIQSAYRNVRDISQDETAIDQYDHAIDYLREIEHLYLNERFRNVIGSNLLGHPNEESVRVRFMDTMDNHVAFSRPDEWSTEEWREALDTAVNDAIDEANITPVQQPTTTEEPTSDTTPTTAEPNTSVEVNSSDNINTVLARLYSWESQVEALYYQLENTSDADTLVQQEIDYAYEQIGELQNQIDELDEDVDADEIETLEDEITSWEAQIEYGEFPGLDEPIAEREELVQELEDTITTVADRAYDLFTNFGELQGWDYDVDDIHNTVIALLRGAYIDDDLGSNILADFPHEEYLQIPLPESTPYPSDSIWGHLTGEDADGTLRNAQMDTSFLGHNQYIRQRMGDFTLRQLREMAGIIVTALSQNLDERYAYTIRNSMRSLYNTEIPEFDVSDEASITSAISAGLDAVDEEISQYQRDELVRILTNRERILQNIGDARLNATLESLQTLIQRLEGIEDIETGETVLSETTTPLNIGGVVHDSPRQYIYDRVGERYAEASGQIYNIETWEAAQAFLDEVNLENASFAIDRSLGEAEDERINRIQLSENFDASEFIQPIRNAYLQQERAGEGSNEDAYTSARSSLYSTAQDYFRRRFMDYTGRPWENHPNATMSEMINDFDARFQEIDNSGFIEDSTELSLQALLDRAVQETLAEFNIGAAGETPPLSDRFFDNLTPQEIQHVREAQDALEIIGADFETPATPDDWSMDTLNEIDDLLSDALRNIEDGELELNPFTLDETGLTVALNQILRIVDRLQEAEVLTDGTRVPITASDLIPDTRENTGYNASLNINGVRYESPRDFVERENVDMGGAEPPTFWYPLIERLIENGQMTEARELANSLRNQVDHIHYTGPLTINGTTFESVQEYADQELSGVDLERWTLGTWFDLVGTLRLENEHDREGDVISAMRRRRIAEGVELYHDRQLEEAYQQRIAEENEADSTAASVSMHNRAVESIQNYVRILRGRPNFTSENMINLMRSDITSIPLSDRPEYLRTLHRELIRELEESVFDQSIRDVLTELNEAISENERSWRGIIEYENNTDYYQEAFNLLRSMEMNEHVVRHMSNMERILARELNPTEFDTFDAMRIIHNTLPEDDPQRASLRVEIDERLMRLFRSARIPYDDWQVLSLSELEGYLRSFGDQYQADITEISTVRNRRFSASVAENELQAHAERIQWLQDALDDFYADGNEPIISGDMLELIGYSLIHVIEEINSAYRDTDLESYLTPNMVVDLWNVSDGYIYENRFSEGHEDFIRAPIPEGEQLHITQRLHNMARNFIESTTPEDVGGTQLLADFLEDDDYEDPPMSLGGPREGGDQLGEPSPLPETPQQAIEAVEWQTTPPEIETWQDFYRFLSHERIRASHSQTDNREYRNALTVLRGNLIDRAIEQGNIQEFLPQTQEELVEFLGYDSLQDVLSFVESSFRNQQEIYDLIRQLPDREIWSEFEGLNPEVQDVVNLIDPSGRMGHPRIDDAPTNAPTSFEGIEDADTQHRARILMNEVWTNINNRRLQIFEDIIENNPEFFEQEDLSSPQDVVNILYSLEGMRGTLRTLLQILHGNYYRMAEQQGEFWRPRPDIQSLLIDFERVRLFMEEIGEDVSEFTEYRDPIMHLANPVQLALSDIFWYLREELTDMPPVEDGQIEGHEIHTPEGLHQIERHINNILTQSDAWRGYELSDQQRGTLQQLRESATILMTTLGEAQNNHADLIGTNPNEFGGNRYNRMPPIPMADAFRLVEEAVGDMYDTDVEMDSMRGVNLEGTREDFESDVSELEEMRNNRTTPEPTQRELVLAYDVATYQAYLDNNALANQIRVANIIPEIEEIVNRVYTETGNVQAVANAIVRYFEEGGEITDTSVGVARSDEGAGENVVFDRENTTTVSADDLDALFDNIDNAIREDDDGYEDPPGSFGGDPAEGDQLGETTDEYGSRDDQSGTQESISDSTSQIDQEESQRGRPWETEFDEQNLSDSEFREVAIDRFIEDILEQYDTGELQAEPNNQQLVDFISRHSDSDRSRNWNLKRLFESSTFSAGEIVAKHILKLLFEDVMQRRYDRASAQTYTENISRRQVQEWDDADDIFYRIDTRGRRETSGWMGEESYLHHIAADVISERVNYLVAKENLDEWDVEFLENFIGDNFDEPPTDEALALKLHEHFVDDTWWLENEVAEILSQHGITWSDELDSYRSDGVYVVETIENLAKYALPEFHGRDATDIIDASQQYDQVVQVVRGTNKRRPAQFEGEDDEFYWGEYLISEPKVISEFPAELLLSVFVPGENIVYAALEEYQDLKDYIRHYFSEDNEYEDPPMSYGGDPEEGDQSDFDEDTLSYDPDDPPYYTVGIAIAEAAARLGIRLEGEIQYFDTTLNPDYLTSGDPLYDADIVSWEGLLRQESGLNLDEYEEATNSVVSEAMDTENENRDNDLYQINRDTFIGTGNTFRNDIEHLEEMKNQRRRNDEISIQEFNLVYDISTHQAVLDNPELSQTLQVPEIIPEIKEITDRVWKETQNIQAVANAINNFFEEGGTVENVQMRGANIINLRDNIRSSGQRRSIEDVLEELGNILGEDLDEGEPESRRRRNPFELDKDRFALGDSFQRNPFA